MASFFKFSHRGGARWAQRNCFVHFVDRRCNVCGQGVRDAEHMRRRNAQRFVGKVAKRQGAQRIARKGPREE